MPKYVQSISLAFTLYNFRDISPPPLVVYTELASSLRESPHTLMYSSLRLGPLFRYCSIVWLLMLSFNPKKCFKVCQLFCLSTRRDCLHVCNQQIPNANWSLIERNKQILTQQTWVFHWKESFHVQLLIAFLTSVGSDPLNKAMCSPFPLRTWTWKQKESNFPQVVAGSLLISDCD